MTRHTRNRQRRLVAEMETGLNHDFFMKDTNLPIIRYRNALMGRELDVTFKWIRTKRHNFVYDEVNGITEYIVDKNVISWVSQKDGQLFKSNMNPKGSSVMTYQVKKVV